MIDVGLGDYHHYHFCRCSGSTSRKRPIPCELTSEDYYNRATEFRVWLRTEKKKSFEVSK